MHKAIYLGGLFINTVSKKYDVVLIGRVAIDFNPVEINRPLNESRTFIKYVGGSPANIAVGLAKLGKNVGFISKVSNDSFGKFVVDFFNENGIDTSNISTAQNGESLGLTFTEIKSPVESSILMYRHMASDLYIEPSDVSEEYIKNSKMLLVSGTALSQSPSREAAFVAIEYAKKHNVTIVFDIDYRNYTWKSKTDMAIYYSLVGKQSHIILGSREEFTLMEHIIDAGNESDEKTAKRWLDYGNKILIIKHGKEGSTLFAENVTHKIKPFPVDVLKSFGGGDGFASAFLNGILDNVDLYNCLEMASASASMLVSAHSCSEAMPTLPEIKEFIEKEKNTYGKDCVKA